MTSPVEDRKRLDLLVTVKAYPNLSKRHGEVVCVAGLRRKAEGEGLAWTRLWPVQFRDMEVANRFRNWQWISLDAVRTSKDRRPESWLPFTDTISVGEKVSTQNATWRERLAMLEPTMVSSMCQAQEQQKQYGTSLAAFRPAEEMEVVVEPNTRWDAGQEARAGQASLLMPDKQPLEWVPLRFKYRYRCQDNVTCPTHSQSVVDWGVLQLYRRSAREHGPEKARTDVVAKLEEIAGPSKDTILIVGNQHQAPLGFMVIGLVYPKRGASEGQSDQLRLELL